jgi:hypothetical protein
MALIFAVVLSVILIYAGNLTGKYPYYTNIRLFRFLVYSLTLMYPVVVTMLSGLVTKYVLGFPLILSNTAFYIVSFILYSVPFYFISRRYLELRKLHDKKKLKRFWIKTGIGFGIFLIFSMGFLIKTFYF